MLNLAKNNRYVCTNYLDIKRWSILQTGNIRAYYFQNEKQFDMYHI
jgi:hypothetical protein